MFSQTFVQLWYTLIFNFNWNLHLEAMILDYHYMWIWEAWEVWNMENAYCPFVLTPIASALADDVSLCVLWQKVADKNSTDLIYDFDFYLICPQKCNFFLIY